MIINSYIQLRNIFLIKEINISTVTENLSIRITYTKLKNYRLIKSKCCKDYVCISRSKSNYLKMTILHFTLSQMQLKYFEHNEQRSKINYIRHNLLAIISVKKYVQNLCIHTNMHTRVLYRPEYKITVAYGK